MKHILTSSLGVFVFTAGILLLSHAAAQTQVIPSSEPLGDYARTVRKDKDKDKDRRDAAVKKYDNDNLPVNDKLSIVGSAPATPAVGTPAAAGEPATAVTNDSDKKPETKTGQTPQERQKGYDQWKDKLSSQKNQIDLMTRELDVMQREYQLRAAAFYADAGNRLRNAGAWDKEDADYKQKLSDKQKVLDDAKQKLDDMQEDARKAGVPSSVRE